MVSRKLGSRIEVSMETSKEEPKGNKKGPADCAERLQSAAPRLEVIEACKMVV